MIATATVLGLLSLTACGGSTTPQQTTVALAFATSTHPVTATPMPAIKKAPDPAAVLLALAPPPPSAQPVAGLDGAKFAAPGQQPACDPIDIRTSFWTSSLTGEAVQHYIFTHPGSHLLSNGEGSGGGHGVTDSWLVMLQPVRVEPGTGDSGQLVYTIAPLSHGSGIRIDALVVPPHANCGRADVGAKRVAPTTTTPPR